MRCYRGEVPTQALARQRNDAEFPTIWDELRVARPRPRLHGPGRPRRRPGDRTGHRLLRLRSDGPQPAPRAPDPAARPPAPAAGGASADRARRRVHRAHRRPAAERRAHAQQPRDGRGLGRAAHRAGGALPRLRGAGAGPDGEQPRLDGGAVGDRLPPGHRQALPRRHHAEEGRGRRPPQLRRRHQLHRVQLPDPAGLRLPRAVPAARLHAADRRQRPVGQPHQRHRPHPPGGGRVRPRDRHPADHRTATAASSARARGPRSGSTPRRRRRTRSSSSGSTPPTPTWWGA